MKNITPLDTRYIPITQQKSCCVPASISMVMYRLGIPLIPQELLGYYLGLVVSQEDKYLFWHPQTGPRPKSGYGTRIGSKQYDPNKVFKKVGIPLKITIHPISKFKTELELITFIVNKVQTNKDILTCFNTGVLNNNDKSGGHVCVIDKVYRRQKKIRLIDPSVNYPKWREFKIHQLKKAMELHPANGGGLWELEKI